MARSASFLVLWAGVLTLCQPALAAGVYKYVEPDGTIVYTNVKPPAGTKARLMRGTASPDHTAPPRDKEHERSKFDTYIHDAATRYRIPEALVWAVMHAESNFDPQAESPVGARGLMQLMPETARRMYVHDLTDIRDNIEGGTRYLRELANRFDGDMVKMVAGYNAGPEAVEKYGGKVPPFAETQDYVRKVIALYFEYKKRQPTPAK